MVSAAAIAQQKSEASAAASSTTKLRASKTLAQTGANKFKTATPKFLRRSNIAILVLLFVYAAVGAAASIVVRSSSQTAANNTAPALIGVQDLSASVAEANTAAAVAFLSSETSYGVEDRTGRNLYLAALDRAGNNVEDVSANLGNDTQGHDALKDINSGLVRFNGQVETARVLNDRNLPGAEASLKEALDTAQNDLAPAIEVVTVRGQESLNARSSISDTLLVVFYLLGLATLLALGVMQLRLFQRTNRVFNLWLVLSTLLVIGSFFAVASGTATRSTSLESANKGGYDSIVLTSQIQKVASQLQSETTVILLGGDTGELDNLYENISKDVAEIETLADSPREQAAAETLKIRWERYETSSKQITALAQNGRRNQAIEQYQGEGLATFNGLNTAVESVLSDNRTQFTNGVNQGANAVSWLPYLVVFLPIAAALALILAVQQRLGEYR